MKFFLLIVFTLLAILIRLVFSQSSITYGSGTTIEIQTGADVCANDIYINGTWSGGGTICQGALPVILSSFTCSVKDRNAMLIWVTEYELNNSGFDIERGEASEKTVWKKIGFVPGNGTTNQHKLFSFEDKKLNTGMYRFRIKQIDFNGNYEYFYLKEDVIIKPPGEFSVSQNYPNPSNPNSKIDYELPKGGKVEIKLYNILGQEVKSILSDEKEAGYYTVELDGSNMGSGVYFYILKAGGFISVKKMMILK